MAVRTIPLDPVDPNFDFDIDLDGETYTFDFHFNQRSNAWYFSIIKLSTGRGVSPIPMNINYLLTDSFLGDSIPPGFFMAFDEEQSETPPGRLDLGVRVKLYYNDLTE